MNMVVVIIIKGIIIDSIIGGKERIGDFINNIFFEKLNFKLQFQLFFFTIKQSF
jgi:hypothetical protein